MKPAKEFKISVDQRQHDWPRPTITGRELKLLAGVDLSYGVWQQLPGPDDPEIADDQEVDVSVPGKEKFFTGKKTTTEGSLHYGSTS
jgi:hypothetical protein